MNDSAIRRTCSKVSYETVVRQAKASKGNMGDASPVLPASLRGRMNSGEASISILKSLPDRNSRAVSMPSSLTATPDDSSR